MAVAIPAPNVLRNYLVVALRNLWRHKTFLFINLGGLVAGLAASMLILLYVKHELSFDRFHANGDRIFRLAHQIATPKGDTLFTTSTSPALVPLLIDDLPEIVQVVRFGRLGRDVSLTAQPYSDQQLIEESRFLYTDPAIFDVFSFKLVEGDSKTVLAEPFNLVLTQAAAAKYFGNENPIGQTLTMMNWWEEKSFGYTITGIVAAPPANSSLQFDFLAPFSTLYSPSRGRWRLDKSWYAQNEYPNYLLLAPGVSAQEAENKIAEHVENYLPARGGSGHRQFKLEPLESIHLYSTTVDDLVQAGDYRYIYLFASIAILILLMAAFNYTNMATSRAVQRAQEVGVRKVVGASRLQLAGQYLGESMMIVFLAFFISLAVVEVALPAFNNFIGRDLSLLSPLTMLQFTGLALVVGLISGAYPALFLAK